MTSALTGARPKRIVWPLSAALSRLAASSVSLVGAMADIIEGTGKSKLTTPGSPSNVHSYRAGITRSDRALAARFAG